MAVYTTEVKSIVQQLSGIRYDEPNGVENGIRKAVPMIFDFSFPIFDDAYKPVLCEKILLAYYTREIGEETYGLWKLRLNQKLNLLMPYYNELYKVEGMKINPFLEIDTKETFAGQGTKVDSETGSKEGSETGGIDRTEHSEINMRNQKDGSHTGTSEENGKTDKTSKEDSSHITSGNTHKSGSNIETGTISSSDRKTGGNDKTFTENEKGERGVKSNSTTTGAGTTSNRGTRTSSSEIDHTGEDQKETTSEGSQKDSDTPQNGLKAVKDGSYLSFARCTDGTGSEDGTNHYHDTNSTSENSTDDGNTQSTATTIGTVDENTSKDTTGEERGSFNEQTSGSKNSNTRIDSTEDSISSGSDTGKLTNSSNETTKINGSTTTTTHETGSETRSSDGSGHSTSSIITHEQNNRQGNAHTTDDYIKNLTGRSGARSIAQIIMEYREAILNIDAEIIKALEPLFMQIW